jgi:RimJ/RimL family protein N-acetyltransferase
LYSEKRTESFLIDRVFGRQLAVEMGVHWLERHRERFRQHAGIRWAIIPKGSTESVGTIGLAITSKDERRAELGIVIGHAAWGKGIGTSAVQLVTGYAFSTLYVGVRTGSGRARLRWETIFDTEIG